MPPKPEYWTLSKQQFKEIKSQLDEIEQYAYAQLEPIGFTKIKRQPDWLGFTIEKKKDEQHTVILFSLIREKPIEFGLAARKWQNISPSETNVELYKKSFTSIEEVIENRNKIFASLKERLEHGL